MSGRGGRVARDVRFERVAPVVPVRDLDAALDRCHRLGLGLRGLGYVDPDGNLHRVGSPLGSS